MHAGMHTYDPAYLTTHGLEATASQARHEIAADVHLLLSVPAEIRRHSSGPRWRPTTTCRPKCPLPLRRCHIRFGGHECAMQRAPQVAAKTHHDSLAKSNCSLDHASSKTRHTCSTRRLPGTCAKKMLPTWFEQVASRRTCSSTYEAAGASVLRSSS